MASDNEILPLTVVDRWAVYQRKLYYVALNPLRIGALVYLKLIIIMLALASLYRAMSSDLKAMPQYLMIYRIICHSGFI